MNLCVLSLVHTKLYETFCYIILLKQIYSMVPVIKNNINNKMEYHLIHILISSLFPTIYELV